MLHVEGFAPDWGQTLELRLLGSPAARWQGAPLKLGAKPLALLVYLAVQGPTDRDILTETFWGTDDKAKGSLRTALKVIRKLPGADIWFHQDGRLLAVRARTNLEAFERLLEGEAYAAALQLWRDAGPSYSGEIASASRL